MSNGQSAKRQRQKEARRIKLEQERKAALARKRRRVMLITLLIGVVLAVVFLRPVADDGDTAADPPPPPATPPADAAFATFVTSMGDIKVRLLPETAPQTVANFVGLATGTSEWTDPETGQTSTEPLYNGTIFHRVIPDFMIQGGDPLGTGMGGPGYQFEDETEERSEFDQPGLLAMANSGPNTNGSQFFITVSTPRHLDGLHTIFGEVVEGQEVAEAISQVATADGDRPVEDVVLEQVLITED